MAIYSKEELKNIGFKSVGNNVYISNKASFYTPEKISIGNNVRIDDFCILSGKIILGNYIHVAAFSALYGGNDGIEIYDYANISSRVSIYSVSDDYSGMTMTNPMIPEEYKNVTSAKVIIEKHVIIGSTCVVLPGCILGEGSSFGCLSFINSNSEPWSVNAGIPARKIKDREKSLLELVKKFEKQLK